MTVNVPAVAPWQWRNMTAQSRRINANQPNTSKERISVKTQTVIRLGKDRASMMNPPNEGTVLDQNGTEWRIGRTSAGMIMLRSIHGAHQDFLSDGMDMLQFCCWINRQF